MEICQKTCYDTLKKKESDTMQFQFCPFCGKKLILKEIGDEGRIPYCEACQKPMFEIPEPCTITCVINEQNEVALLRQDYVSTSTFVCVAGHIKIGETAETTAAREVEEEIGLPVKELHYLGDFAFEKKELLMMGFLAFVEKKEFKLSGEVDSAEWFSMEEATKKVRQGSIAMQVIEQAVALCRKLRKVE